MQERLDEVVNFDWRVFRLTVFSTDPVRSNKAYHRRADFIDTPNISQTSAIGTISNQLNAFGHWNKGTQFGEARIAVAV